jgi:hypothetical protein
MRGRFGVMELAEGLRWIAAGDRSCGDKGLVLFRFIRKVVHACILLRFVPDCSRPLVLMRHIRSPACLVVASENLEILARRTKTSKSPKEGLDLRPYPRASRH